MKTFSAKRPVVVLIASVTVMALCVGLRNTFGLYLRPITETFGWGREVFALAVAIQNLVWGLAAPFTGGLSDRYGAGRVIAVGGIVYALGIYLMSQSTTPLSLTLSTGVLVGLGTSATGFGVVLGVVGRIASDQQRSLYLGIASAGGSVGQFVLVSLSQGLITKLGWMQAMVSIALVALIMVPLAAAMAGHPRKLTSAGTATSPLGAFRQAGSQTRFWCLFAGFFGCGFQVTFIMTHLPAYLTDHQMAPAAAAMTLSVIGLFNILGTFSFGYLGGRFSKRAILCALNITRALVMTLFLTLPMSIYTALGFGASMGFLWLGTVPLTSALTGQMYGVRFMNTLFGALWLGHQIGAFLGVWVGGKLFDLTGSYDMVWTIVVILAVISGIVHWPIDERSQEEIDSVALLERARPQESI